MKELFNGLQKISIAALLITASSFAYAADYPANVTNKVTVTLPAGVTDPNESNNNNGVADGESGADVNCDADTSTSSACATDINALLANTPEPTKAFSPATIAIGGTSTLTITLTNNNSFVATLQADFVDTLPAGVVIAPTPNAGTSCTGKLTAVAGANTITLASGATIPSGAPGTCTIAVDVTSSTAGVHTNQLLAGALDTRLGASTAASADLTVAPTISVNDVAVDEDAGTATFTVSLSGATTADVTFDYATADDAPVSAIAGTDYTATSGSGTITTGNTSTTFTVAITDDFLAEGAETYLVNLSNLSANVVAAGNDVQGVGTINDEPAPAASDTVYAVLSGPATVVEGATMTDYTVSLIDSAGNPVTVTSDTDVTVVFANGTAGNVFTNDTVNGAGADNTNVDTVTVTNDGGLTGVTIDANGNVIVPATSTPGTYTITYEICSAVAICDTATVEVLVSGINANDDDLSSTPVDPTAGGTAGNVFTNDTVNGAGADNTNVDTVTVTNDGGLTGVMIDADGNVIVPATSTPGTYTITYEICNADGVCDTATVTVVVGSVDAMDDDLSSTPVDPTAGGTAGNVFTNDTVNGAGADNTNVDTVTVTNDGGLTGVTIDADGNVIVPATSTPGTYTITYEICNADGVCDTATVTVVVDSLEIIATDDDMSANPVNGSDGGTAGNVFTNDTLAGNSVDQTMVSVAVTDDNGSGITITPTGVVVVPANTPAGTYTITYEICEIADPSNCDTATITVVVAAATIIATDDDFTASPVSGLAGGDVGNVFGNDSLNGQTIDPSLITITVTDDAGIGATITADGTVTVPADTPAGTYTLSYQICENLNPTNCASASITVEVLPPVIVANDDDFSGTDVNGNTS